jgi:sulfatase modifying factor 1
MNILRFTVAAGLILLFSAGSALRAQSITMSYVTVGNPGNPADPATGDLYGSVSYTYDIGEYDVTDSQYCTFLNDVDPSGANTLALYSPQGDAEFGLTFNSGAASGSKYSVISGYTNMPVVDVNYWDTLRFVNWMNNGEGNASTESGAYTLLGGTPTPGNASALLANPQPNSGATVWLPSENEWYKAAYYDPLNSTYSTYATQSDTAPGIVVGNGANEANYYDGNYTEPGPDYLTAVGSFTGSKSYYGTFDQSGDVFNLIDTTLESDYPVLRGGDWLLDAEGVSSSARNDANPSGEYGGVGFRVASIPEPNSLIFILAGAVSLTLTQGKRFKF